MTFKDVVQRFITTLQNEPNALSQTDFESIQELITGCSVGEVKPNAGPFVTLCHLFTEALIATKKSVTGIDLMIHAIEKLQTHPSQLTSLHSSLCELCLDSKCLNPALAYLDVDYTDINKEDNVFQHKHILLYHYYGGMIYAALKNFHRASHFFEIVLTVPQVTIHPVAEEAFKKHIILTLFLYDRLPENLLPRYTSMCVIKHRKSVGQAYTKLALEYASLDYDKIRRLITSHSQDYELDENMGLVKQILNQVRKRNIQRLTETFLTLSLRDVASHVGLATENEAEMFILQMIDEGEIFATINQKDGMVVFQDSPEKFDSETVFQKLQDDMDECIKLINTLKKMNNETPSNQES